MEAKPFLEGIAARLGRRGIHVPPSQVPAGPPDSYVARPLGDGTTERAARFKEELELVGGKLTFALSCTEAQRALGAEIQAWKAERLVSWSLEEFETWGLSDLLPRTSCAAFDTRATTPSSFSRLCANADLGITTVDFGIVNTGTLAIATNARRPRAVSLLPTVHVALVRESQLVDRIGQAFTEYRRHGKLAASNVHFITGPSRTSDIENDLSIGVHGPAAVSVILWLDVTAQAKGAR